MAPKCIKPRWCASTPLSPYINCWTSVNYDLTWYFINNNIYIDYGNIPIRLVKFERNFTKRNFYFGTQFMSKCNYYFETEGVPFKSYILKNENHITIFFPLFSFHMYSTLQCEFIYIYIYIFTLRSSMSTILLYFFSLATPNSERTGRHIKTTSTLKNWEYVKLEGSK